MIRLELLNAWLAPCCPEADDDWLARFAKVSRIDERTSYVLDLDRWERSCLTFLRKGTTN